MDIIGLLISCCTGNTINISRYLYYQALQHSVMEVVMKWWLEIGTIISFKIRNNYISKFSIFMATVLISQRDERGGCEDCRNIILLWHPTSCHITERGRERGLSKNGWQPCSYQLLVLPDSWWMCWNCIQRNINIYIQIKTILASFLALSGFD